MMPPADSAAIASVAPAVRRMREFVDWVGEGRALTQTGRLKRADALALVDLLDTGDVLDPRFPIQSSTDLYGVNLCVEWAKACRLVRVVRGRIVPVSKNAKLLSRPLELIVRMLEALPRLVGDVGHSMVAADAARTVEAVLGALVGHGGRMSMERACEIAWATATSRYWIPEATEDQLRWARMGGDADVRRTLHAVAGLGVLTVADDEIALTDIGPQCLNAWLGLGTSASRALRVRVTLEGSADPVIWRLVRVPADIRLDRLHQLLGAVIGWQDSHLHVFERGSERYGHPDPELEIEDDRATRLGDVLVDEGDRLAYEYDFGDSWQHEIVLEAIEPGDRADAFLRCLGGAGRCPPEDVGGIPGYERLRSVVANPHHPEHSEVLEWLGLDDAREFDAAAFDLDRANAAVVGVLAARFQ